MTNDKIPAYRQAGKCQNKSKITISKSKILVLLFGICALCFGICHLVFAQEPPEVEFNLDVNAPTIPLPKIFSPNIDLSGRGFHRHLEWPQELAAPEAIEAWQKDIGLHGFYRLKYNLWEIADLAKNKNLQNKLLANYDAEIKKISDSGGTVILDIFGTPAGLGKVLDKRSPPLYLKAFKDLLKDLMRNLSCEKKYNIWYEVWSTPDLDDFFLGRRADYLNMYRVAGEAAKELEKETKMHIPLGGPSISWWFQNPESNSVITPERSLIYELIRFCYHYRLPLDFISWHAYSTDPRAEQELTTYNKKTIDLIRTWLSYFRFNKNLPLVVDEWNFDSGANLLSERSERSNVTASYILSRLQNMYTAGLDNQVYYCLEDFQNNKENVTSNPGVFWFEAESSDYKGGAKSTFPVFRMLGGLGENFFPVKQQDEFLGLLAAKNHDELATIFYNYIDPDLAKNYLSRNIASLNSSERKILLGIIQSDQLKKILHQELDIAGLRTTNKIKALLKKAQELSLAAQKAIGSVRNVKLVVKNLKGNYLYQRFAIDSSCALNCKFAPLEEKEINITEAYQETLKLNPYSVQMIILKHKPPQPEASPVAAGAQPGVSVQAPEARKD